MSDTDEITAIRGAFQHDMRLHAGLASRTVEQERKIVNMMVTEYRSGSLTEEKLWGFVGQIVGVRDLLSSVRTDVAVAEAVLKEETKDA